MSTQALSQTAAPPGNAAPSAAPSSGASPPAGGGAAGGGAAPTGNGAPASGGAAPAAAPAAQPPEQNWARAQKQIRDLQVQLKAATDRVTALSPHEQLVQSLKDPEKRWKAIEEAGISYQEWTERLLRDAGATTDTPRDQLPPAVQKALERVEALEKDLATERESKAEAKRAEQLTNAKEQVRTKLFAGGKYELSAAFEHEGAVVHEYLRRQQEEGVAPDEHEVCAALEQQLEQTLDAQLAKLAGTAKGKAMLLKLAQGLSAAPAQNGARESPRVQTGQPSGLNNGLSAESGDGVDVRTLTPSQKRARALERANKSVQ